MKQLFTARQIGRFLGFFAYLAFWTACCLGVLSGFPKRTSKIRGRIIKWHSRLSVIAVFAGLMHPLMFLLGFNALLTPVQIFLPFSAPYHPVLYGFGTLAFYGFLLIVLSCMSTLIKKYNVWRTIHLGAYLCYLLALAHGMLVGPEARQLSFFTFYCITFLFLLALILAQILCRFTPKCDQNIKTDLK